MPGTTFRAAVTALSVAASFTLAAIAIHGYHYGIADQAIYLPAIKNLIEPDLYPRNAELFMAQGRASALVWLLAGATALARAPLEWTVLLGHLAATMLYVAGCWMVATACFAETRQRLAAVASVVVLQTMSVAGTGLALAEPYMHPRTLATAFLLFGVYGMLTSRRALAVAAAVAAFVVHPLMGAFGVCLLVLFAIPTERLRLPAGQWALVPFPALPTDAWQRAVATRSYYSLANWNALEWFGLFAPFVVLAWLVRASRRAGLCSAERLARNLLVYGAALGAVTLVIGVPDALQPLQPLQPARFLHLIYVLTILLVGGTLGGSAFASRYRWWPAMFAPVALVMAMNQSARWESSAHIELPGRDSGNRYLAAYRWIRSNTPRDAFFAVDPRYMSAPDNDKHGLRGLAERSQMADISKDAAAVTLVPALASDWDREVRARAEWPTLDRDDFARLRTEHGATWALIDRNTGGMPDLDCPYDDGTLAVCRTPEEAWADVEREEPADPRGERGVGDATRAGRLLEDDALPHRIAVLRDRVRACADHDPSGCVCGNL